MKSYNEPTVRKIMNSDELVEYIKQRDPFPLELTLAQVHEALSREVGFSYLILKAYETVHPNETRPPACDDWVGPGWGCCVLPKGHPNCHQEFMGVLYY